MARILNLRIKLDRGETAKVATAAAILVLIIVVSSYQILTERQPRRDKLVVVVPSRLYVDQEVPLKVSIVNYKGEYIGGRNDLVEVSIVTEGRGVIGVRNDSKILWSKKLNIQLREGAADIWFRDPDVKTVTIIAKQVEGGTPLEETKSTFISYH